MTLQSNEKTHPATELGPLYPLLKITHSFFISLYRRGKKYGAKYKSSLQSIYMHVLLETRFNFDEECIGLG